MVLFDQQNVFYPDRRWSNTAVVVFFLLCSVRRNLLGCSVSVGSWFQIHSFGCRGSKGSRGSRHHSPSHRSGPTDSLQHHYITAITQHIVWITWQHSKLLIKQKLFWICSLTTFLFILKCIYIHVILHYKLTLILEGWCRNTNKSVNIVFHTDQSQYRVEGNTGSISTGELGTDATGVSLTRRGCGGIDFIWRENQGPFTPRTISTMIILMITILSYSKHCRIVVCCFKGVVRNFWEMLLKVEHTEHQNNLVANQQ